MAITASPVQFSPEKRSISRLRIGFEHHALSPVEGGIDFRRQRVIRCAHGMKRADQIKRRRRIRYPPDKMFLAAGIGQDSRVNGSKKQERTQPQSKVSRSAET